MTAETGIRPIVIDELRALAKKHGLRRLVLFGSRARGDFRRASDIDLAAEGGGIDAFALDAEDCTSTLLKYDIVDMGLEIDEKLGSSIEREGITLYEKV